MILAINLNASLDKRYEIEDIQKGQVMRARHVENTAGGKGQHVANVATILKEECVVTGLLGGKSGDFIEEKIKEYGIRQDFVKIKDETRSCLAFITDDLMQTEVLEPGPEVSEIELQWFLKKYMDLIGEATIIVASGSVPKNVPNNIYRKLIEIANSKGKRFLLDTSGELLREGIEGKPYFIKPNRDEIEALTGRKVTSIKDAIREIKEFQSKGIKFVAISLGAQGSIAGYAGKFYKVKVPKVEAVNPVGSGDAFVAGVAVAIQREYEIEDILKLAAACGTANVLEKETGFVTRETVNDLFEKIIIEEL